MNAASSNSGTPQKTAGKTSVLIVATQNDAISKYRSIVSLSSLTAAFFEIEIHIDYILSETNNVLLEYEKKYSRTISKVIFTGGGSLLKGLAEVAVNNFRAEIEIGHPFNKVNAPEFLRKVLETAGPEFAVALGLALRKSQ